MELSKQTQQDLSGFPKDLVDSVTKMVGKWSYEDQLRFSENPSQELLKELNGKYND